MVFCSTRRNVDFIANNLNDIGIHAIAIHGGLVQSKRIRALDEFHGKEVGVLVCTDVAARGLDIKGVSHVYNYDLPPNSQDYIHRIGRTARAGKEGKAISILSQRDYENFTSILRDESLDIVKIELPKIDLVRTNSPSSRDRKRSFSRSSGQGGSRRGGGSRGERGGRRDGGGERNKDGFRGSRGGRKNSGGGSRYSSGGSGGRSGGGSRRTPSSRGGSRSSSGGSRNFSRGSGGSSSGRSGSSSGRR